MKFHTTQWPLYWRTNSQTCINSVQDYALKANSILKTTRVFYVARERTLLFLWPSQARAQTALIMAFASKARSVPSLRRATWGCMMILRYSSLASIKKPASKATKNSHWPTVIDSTLVSCVPPAQRATGSPLALTYATHVALKCCQPSNSTPVQSSPW